MIKHCEKQFSSENETENPIVSEIISGERLCFSHFQLKLSKLKNLLIGKNRFFTNKTAQGLMK